MGTGKHLPMAKKNQKNLPDPIAPIQTLVLVIINYLSP
jgi:hypothetical protein